MAVRRSDWDGLTPAQVRLLQILESGIERPRLGRGGRFIGSSYTPVQALLDRKLARRLKSQWFGDLRLQITAKGRHLCTAARERESARRAVSQ